MNRVILIGRLVRDPELRYTPSGIASVRMTIAVDRSFTKQDGTRETDFIDLRAWRKLAKTCAAHLKKGRLIAVEGRLEVRSYEHEGQKRKSHEIICDSVRFLDRAKESGAPSGNADDRSTDTGYEGGYTDDGFDEEVPF